MNRCESVMRRVPGIIAVAATVAVLVTGCSPEVGFPAVHDMPAPRADTPLTPDQVKQATDSLISERDHLATQTNGTTQGNAQSGAAPNASGTATSDARKKPAAQPAAQGADANAPMTAGAYAKP